jgi:hypothetical protein
MSGTVEPKIDSAPKVRREHLSARLQRAHVFIRCLPDVARLATFFEPLTRLNKENFKWRMNWLWRISDEK